MTWGAQAPQAAHPLSPRGLVVVPTFVRFEPHPTFPVRDAPADLAAMSGPGVHRVPQSLPIAALDAATHVREPTRHRHQINEQTATKLAVLTGQGITHIG